MYTHKPVRILVVSRTSWPSKLRFHTFSVYPLYVRTAAASAAAKTTKTTRLPCHATKARASLASHLIARLAHKIHHDVRVRSGSSPWQSGCRVTSSESCGQGCKDGWSGRRTEMRRNLTFPIPVCHILPYLKSDRTVGSRFSCRSSPLLARLLPVVAFIFPPCIALNRAELPSHWRGAYVPLTASPPAR